MEQLLKKFSYLSDAADEIERLTKEADTTPGRKEKQRLRQEAQDLADAYQRHVNAGGNDKQQFTQIV